MTSASLHLKSLSFANHRQTCLLVKQLRQLFCGIFMSSAAIDDFDDDFDDDDDISE
jgi:hypothetical protein